MLFAVLEAALPRGPMQPQLEVEYEGLAALEAGWEQEEVERHLTAGLYALPMCDKITLLSSLPPETTAAIIGTHFVIGYDFPLHLDSYFGVKVSFGTCC